MTQSNENQQVPDLYLEGYRLDELVEEDRLRVRHLLEGDPRLRQRLEALESSDREIRGRYPASLMVERIRARLDAQRAEAAGNATRVPRTRWLVAATVAATAVVILSIRLVALRPAGSTTDDVRLKGSQPELVLYRKTPSGSERLEPGAFARGGDLIRLGYRPAGRVFGVIVSVDGEGIVTQHLPSFGGRAAALEPRGTVLLDAAYELDDRPGWERFYLITGETAFDVDPVLRAARAAAARGTGTASPRLDLPDGLTQSVFSLTKKAER